MLDVTNKDIVTNLIDQFDDAVMENDQELIKELLPKLDGVFKQMLLAPLQVNSNF